MNDEVCKNCFKAELIGLDEMQNALSAIAQEVQRFHGPKATSITKIYQDQDLFEKFTVVKTKLNFKKRQVTKLRKNLNIACIVAKTIISAKEKESFTLTNHIRLARNQYEDLLQKSKLNFRAVEEIKLENEILKDKMEAIRIFLRLGYEELQKMRDEPTQEITVMQQLKEIIVCCGQYYADYYNEREQKVQLEQKNRFLSHKINILTNNLQALTNELSSVHHQNIKYQKENATIINKETNNGAHRFIPLPLNRRGINTTTNELLDKKCTTQNLDFKSHLSIIKNLLDNQDDMLKDLKKLSEELS